MPKAAAEIEKLRARLDGLEDIRVCGVLAELRVEKVEDSDARVCAKVPGFPTLRWVVREGLNLVTNRSNGCGGGSRSGGNE